jgi:prepilin-type N-terminal cleavage/methylation domain-containing protein
VSVGKRQNGFSLIEVLVTMVIFSIIIVAASQTFISLLRDFKTQSKITATNIEGMLGLEVLRRDIAHAGLGLYWQFDPVSSPSASPSYPEITADAKGSALNDAPDGAVPRALVLGGGSGLNGSDRIAVKSIDVPANSQSEHWNYLNTNPTNSVNTWAPPSENISGSDYVIVVKPDQSNRYLMYTSPGSNFSTTMLNTAMSYSVDQTSLIFDLGTTSPPRVPFNRADYYIKDTNVPSRCAAGTGVLYKSVMNQGSGSDYLAAIPLLDCVADMQTGYRYDSTGGGYADTIVSMASNTGAVNGMPADAPSARQIREVRVYILAQEGQRDKDYTYPFNTVLVGDTGFGRAFDLSANIPDWQHYRWKLYTLIIKPLAL